MGRYCPSGKLGARLSVSGGVLGVGCSARAALLPGTPHKAKGSESLWMGTDAVKPAHVITFKLCYRMSPMTSATILRGFTLETNTVKNMVPCCGKGF